MTTVHGSCLCGDVTWEADGPFEWMHHCHCGRCRKAHGTAFATSLLAPATGFRTTRGDDRIVVYAPEGAFARPFCGRCGAHLSSATGDGQYIVHTGSLRDDPGVRPIGRIFMGSNAPWYRPFDALPRFDAWAPGMDLPVMPDPVRDPAPPGVVRGSCLCGGVAFVVEGSPTTARYCHCSRCRKARAAAHATNLIAPIEQVRFERGGDRVRTFELAETRYFAQFFCADCGGKLPRLDPGRGIAIVPMGALDDDPGIRAACQIFTASKAPWIDLDPTIPPWPEAAPS